VSAPVVAETIEALNAAEASLAADAGAVEATAEALEVALRSPRVEAPAEALEVAPRVEPPLQAEAPPQRPKTPGDAAPTSPVPESVAQERFPRVFAAPAPAAGGAAVGDAMDAPELDGAIQRLADAEVVVAEDRAAVAALREKARADEASVRGAKLCGNQPLDWVVLTKLQTSRARSNRSRFG